MTSSASLARLNIVPLAAVTDRVDDADQSHEDKGNSQGGNGDTGNAACGIWLMPFQALPARLARLQQP